MFRKCFFTFIIAMLPLVGYPFDLTNWYLRGLVGYNLLAIPSTPEVDIDADPGYIVGGAVGYKLSRTFRLEAEFSYRNNAFDRLVIHGDGANFEIELDGSISSLAYMGNFFLDFPLKWPLVPYIGAGIGGVRERGKWTIPLLNGTPDEVRFRIKDGGMAYQVIGGLNILHCNRIDCGIEYHFLDLIDEPHSVGNHSICLTCRATY